MSRIPSPDEIEARRPPHGGWDRATLESWGVVWPPESGWATKLKEKWKALQMQKAGPNKRVALIEILQGWGIDYGMVNSCADKIMDLYEGNASAPVIDYSGDHIELARIRATLGIAMNYEDAASGTVQRLWEDHRETVSDYEELLNELDGASDQESALNVIRGMKSRDEQNTVAMETMGENIKYLKDELSRANLLLAYACASLGCEPDVQAIGAAVRSMELKAGFSYAPSPNTKAWEDVARVRKGLPDTFHELNGLIPGVGMSPRYALVYAAAATIAEIENMDRRAGASGET